MGVHQGAQCDRASLAQNYYYNGLRFFYPEVNETFCGDGIVSVEMPLPSYFAAILYKFFGYNEQWFRLLTFTFFTIGMYALFLWFKLYFKTLTAFALLLIINSSPIILFYSISFLPDIVSLSLVLVAWYLFFRQHISHPFLPLKNHNVYQILFIITLSLSLAIKTTSGIQWFSMLGLLFLSYFRFLKIELLQRKKLIISLAIASLMPIGWQLWSRHLGEHHRKEYFMMQVPLSENWTHFKNAFDCYFANWPEQTLGNPIIYLALSLLVIIIFLKKWINPTLYFLSLINTIGSVLFFGLMVQQFKYHDYYIICLMPMFFINWIALASALPKIKSKHWYFKVAIFGLVIYAFSFQYKLGKRNFEERFEKGNYWEQSQQDIEDYKQFKIKLNAVGINYTHKVAAGYDGAPNNMLYLLHLRGFRVQANEHSDRKNKIVKDCQPLILIINDSNMLNEYKAFVKSVKLKAEYKYLKAYEVLY